MTARSHSRKNTTLYEVRLSDRGEHHYQQYRIGNQLGKGGFANVYEITKEHELCTNAVKIILKTDRHGKSDPLILEKVLLCRNRSSLRWL
jgi:serine/threonine protein kinase